MNQRIDIYEHEQIKAVIDFMKAEKNISDISEANGISTITTNSLCLLYEVDSIYLQAGQIVTLGSINYQVLTVNLKSLQFTITASGLYHMSTDPIPVKVLDVTKWNLAANFKFGSRTEVNQILNIESKQQLTKETRYPLIWLIVNTPEDSDSLDFDHKSTLKLVIAHLSQLQLRSNDRLDDIVKKILRPLHTLFIRTIYSPYFSNVFLWEYGKLPNRKYIRYFYGSSDKQESVFDSITDAIECEVDCTFQNQY